MPDRKKKLRGERFRHKHQQLKWLSFVKSFHADRSVIKENNKLKHCKWAKGFQETEIATLVCWELNQLILFRWIIISRVISNSLKSGALPCSKLLIPQLLSLGCCCDILFQYEVLVQLWVPINQTKNKSHLSEYVNSSQKSEEEQWVQHPSHLPG